MEHRAKRGGVTSVGGADPLPKEAVIALRAILKAEGRLRDLALFNVGIDTYLRSIDLVSLKVADVVNPDGKIRASFFVMQRKTKKPVECRLYREAQESIQEYLCGQAEAGRPVGPRLFPMSTGHYRRLMGDWKALLRWGGHPLPDGNFSTHSLRKAKPAQIYEETGSLIACMHLLGQKDPKVTERYLGIDRKAAQEIAAKVKF